MSVFEQDTQIEKGLKSNLYHANLASRWSVYDVCNGGYVMSIAAKAMAASVAHPHPLSITGYYLEKSQAGPMDIKIETIRAGKNVSTASAQLLQNNTECVRIIGSFTDFDNISGETFLEESPPRLAPPDQCAPFIETRIEINNRIELLLPPGYKENRGQPGNPSELIGWVKFKEGGEPDVFSLLLFADALPPAIFNRVGPVGWVPTLEMTVHIRAKPAPGLLLCRFRSRYLTNGYLEEDGDIWDSEGKLVAMSRQLAKLRLPDKS